VGFAFSLSTLRYGDSHSLCVALPAALLEPQAHFRIRLQRRPKLVVIIVIDQFRVTTCNATRHSATAASRISAIRGA